MKKVVLIAVCLMTLLPFFGCKNKEQNNAQLQTIGTVTLVSKVKDADIWLLPDTEKNRKTTLWGTASASDVKTGESRQAPLCEAGDGGLYLIRMIDSEKFYYSADGVMLKTGWTAAVEGENLQSITLTVTDENGVLKNTYTMFAARL